jgi:hypothetical protein
MLPSRARPQSLVLVWAVVLFGACIATPAWACGVTVGGAAGISSCSLEEHQEAVRRKWRIGASYAFTSTALRFDGEHRVDEERHAVLVTVDYRPSRRMTLQAGAGTFLGDIWSATEHSRIDPGFAGAIGGSYRVLDADGAIPFVLLTGQLSAAATTTVSPGEARVGYTAFDVRLGAVVGTTVLDVLTPYVVGRAFGGPIFWRYQGEAVSGTDIYKYQVGGGLAVSIARRFDLFVEGVPLGERGLAGGGGFAF